MCSAFALITGGLQAATPVLLPNVIYLALWPHSACQTNATPSHILAYIHTFSQHTATFGHAVGTENSI